MTPAANIAPAGVNALEHRITIDLSKVRLRDALIDVARLGGVGIVHADSTAADDRIVSVHMKNATVGAVLRVVLKGSGYRSTLSTAGMIVIVRDVKQADAISGAGTVFGRIRDSVSTSPMPGAVVMVRGMSVQTTTTDSGFYVIPRVPAGVRTVVVRMLGFAPAEKVVMVADSANVEANFMLHMGMSRLQEVVTTATGQRRRLELGNDITNINADSIVATQPVANVTQLLESRVPGLTVQHTSGAPGDPSRLLLRGASSAYRSNDPIVILDGIRVYSSRSDTRSSNLAAQDNHVGQSITAAPAPSPLDEIDPNSIETIEVLKGPSAATLYGADAANGVIVITTKRGRPGPPTWNVTAERGISYLPGSYPDEYLRWGHTASDNAPRWCSVYDFTCVADSVTRYQTLNDPSLSPLGHGDRSAATIGVSGGAPSLQYAFTASASQDIGLLNLPAFAASNFSSTHDGSAVPDWMQRPHDYKTFSATSRLTAQIGSTADVSLTTTVSHDAQQRTSLENQLGSLMFTYVDPTTGTYQLASGTTYFSQPQLLSSFYERTTDAANTFTNALSASWRPRSWLSGAFDLGINQLSRTDEVSLPRDYSLADDSIGLLNRAHGSSLVGTVNARGTLTAPTVKGWTLATTVGANYVNTHTDDETFLGSNIPVGATSPDQAVVYNGSESQDIATTFGWYIEPTLKRDLLYISTGVRFDGGTAYGTHASLAGFPKVGLSYLISGEPFFPFKSFFDLFRLRLAYGDAGQQPGPGDKIRLYSTHTSAFVDSSNVDIITLASLGNSVLRPERSVELEGGFDADMLHDRLSLGLTGYRKTRNDALMSFPLPPSVYGENTAILANIGIIRNSGIEGTLNTQLVRSDGVTWTAQVNVSRDRNLVVALGNGVRPFNLQNNGSLSRIQAGYPLFGTWARPIVGYADANGDGILERNEVQVGDSAAYLGAPTPNFEASLFTGISLLRGRVRVDAGFAYQNGMTQVNATSLDHAAASQTFNDPHTPLSEQAGVLVLLPGNFLGVANDPIGAGSTVYGIVQTVSTLRFNSLSVAFSAPSAVARRLGASALSIAVQGTNLGLSTNYRGKDPNVNAYSSGNGVLDTGQLPEPRTWQIRMSLQY
ncbi:MAG TPA: TonB-dependent receptor plug domain-containing protein [Gemmatimonadaceae bacterium]|nr:TonB-dependent receptor plug domain-containing protein [Gemmatimonadaceae bacterium]